MTDALTDPRSQALLNTSPDELDTLAGQFSTVSGHASTSASGLRGAHGDLNWTGTSADLFRTKLGKLPGDLDTVDASFSEIASALRTYATHVGPIKQRFSPLYSQLGTDAQNLSTAQTSASSAQTAYNTAKGAKGAKPTDSSVTGAQTTLTTAQGKVSTLQGDVTSLNTRACHLLDEFDTVRTACLHRIKDAAGKAPQHHSSFWGSVCHIADDVGGFIGKTATGIYHSVTDLPSAFMTFVKHPSWENFGRLASDVAVTASLVAMVAAPFAAPELLEADGAAAAATDIATDAAADTAADATAGATTDAVTDTTTGAVTDATTDAAGNGAKTYSTFTKVATRTDQYASRTFTGAGGAQAYADARSGNYKGALLDVAFIAAPNLGKVPRSIDGVKTLGDRTTDALGIGDRSAESAKAASEATTNVRNWYAMGLDPGTAASLEGVSDKALSKMVTEGSTTPGAELNSATTAAVTHAGHAATIATKLGKPVSIAIDDGGYDRLKEHLKGEPAEDAPQHPIFSGRPWLSPPVGLVG